MNVLVIEDNEVDFLLVGRALGDQFVLSRASHLAAGLELASQEKFDLVVLDLSLGDSSGYETFEKTYAALPDIPILILSGSDDEELALRAVSHGAQDFVRKAKLLDYPLDRTARYAIERRRAERELQESERFARSTVNSLAVQIAILDETGHILAVNAAWQRFASESQSCAGENSVGMNYLDVCDQIGGDAAAIAQASAEGIRAVLHRELPGFEMEYASHSATEERWTMMRATPFEGDGPKRVVISHEDVTSRKVAERLAREQGGLREAVAGMEQVLGVVAHELRTPLAALRAIGEFLMTDGARDSKQADQFLQEMAEEVDRMSDTVDNLLEAARLNSGRAKWNWSDFDLAEVINDAITSTQSLINELVRVESSVELAALTCAGDADAVRRLLINLLSNASKYTTAGEIAVSAKKYTDVQGTWVELVVRDTGCGIAADKVARLGEAFALNSGVVGNNYTSGTGLGLSICKGIARAHGGELLIQSEEGRGTTVTFCLRADLPFAAAGDTTFRAPAAADNNMAA